MAFCSNYSRTSRLADLYEEKLYAKLLNKEAELKAMAKETGEKLTEPIDRNEVERTICPYSETDH